MNDTGPPKRAYVAHDMRATDDSLRRLAAHPNERKTMSQKTKRVVNAFVLGTVTALLALAIEHWADLTNAVTVGDWISLKNLALSVGFGAILAGLRALQAGVGVIPSPEPDENATKV